MHPLLGLVATLGALALAALGVLTERLTRSQGAQMLQRSRAAAHNIVPDLGSCTKHIEAVLPALRGKVSGMSLKVPVANGSLVDMVSFTKKPLTVQAVNEAVQAAAGGPRKQIIEYSNDPLVSTDVLGSPYSCTFDALSTMVPTAHTVKTIAWFDNGWAYARRTLELAAYTQQLAGGKL